MDERVVQFRVGVVILATLIIAAILVALFSDVGGLFQGRKNISIIFSRAPDIAKETPVRKHGILVGRVRGVENVFENGQDRVRVHCWIDATALVRQSDVAVISRSLFGESSIEFVSGEGKPSPDLIADGAQIVGRDAADVLEIVTNLQDNVQGAVRSFNAAGVSIRDAGQEVNELAARLNRLLSANDEQLHRILAKTETALENFGAASASANSLLGDEKFRRQLQQALSDLPGVIADIRDVMAGLERAATEAGDNLENLKGLTGPLGERGADIVDRLDGALGRIDEMVEQFAIFGEAINNEEGTLGQLLHNNDLYQNVNAAVENIRDLTCRLRPIVEDARVFTDKIAREPSRLGVRGALKKESKIK